MRLLFASPRFGEEVAGGAEQVVAELSTRLAQRGHEVHVLTTTAKSYVTWANVFPPGDSVEGAITVHRFAVERPRARGPTRKRASLKGYRRWAPRLMAGRPLRGAGSWLQRNSADFDIVIPYTYQHYTTWDAVMLSRAPVLLHPAAHPDAALNASALELVAHRVAMMSLHTPEEMDLIRRRFRVDASRLRVVGMGVAELATSPDAITRFRREFRLRDVPYVVYVGRIDQGKGTLELAQLFAQFKRRHPGPLRLVLIGDEMDPVPPHPDVITTGFVPEATRNAAIAGAEVLIHPSMVESFSLVIAEAWLLGTPTLVQGLSAVLHGQISRSGGGIAYVDRASFDAALERLLGDSHLRKSLARSGARYIRDAHGWPDFLDSYEELLDDTVRLATSRKRWPATA